MATLPLHLKHVFRLDWEAAEAYVLPQHEESWAWGRRCCCDEELLISASPPQCVVREAALTATDIRRLLEFGIIERCSTAPRNTCNVFSVVEIGKSRRRMIIEPLLNDILLFAGEVCFPTLRELQLEILNSEGAAQLDFASFYNHFELPPNVRNFFTFMHEGTIYQLAVIATGQRQCPALAQALTASLTQKATSQVSGAEKVTGSAYIDNIRFCGNRIATQEVFEHFVAQCKTLNITINDLDTSDPCLQAPFCTSYEFLGIHFDHATKTTTLTEKTRNKLWDILPELKSPGTITLRNVLRFFGNIVWAARVLGTPLAMTYHLIKFIRRRSSTHDLDSVVDIWNSLLPRIERNITFLLFASPHIVRANAVDRQIVLYTDACPSGYGCVLFINGGIKIVAGNFTKVEHINVLEARALGYGIDLLPSHAHTALTAIDIFIDNTSCLGAFKKGRSANFLINQMMPKFQSELFGKNYMATIHYVRSASNCADVPSRLFEDIELPSSIRVSTWQEYV